MSVSVRDIAIPAPAVDAAVVALRSARSRAAAGGLVINVCALCGTTDATMLFHVDRGVIVQCPRCELVRDATRPSSPGAFYDQEYYSSDDPKGGYANYVLDADINKRTFRDRLRKIERGYGYGRYARLLDVGCALGDFVLEAKQDGWDAEGVEISPAAAAQARSRGARVHCGVLQDLGLPAQSYDAITLYDVIEHLPDPVAALREIRRLLTPEGVLHLVTPNVGGLQAKVLGRYWYHYKPGEHLFYFSPKTLRAAVQRALLRWDGWSMSASYVTVSYVLNRLRYYAPAIFGSLEQVGRTLGLGPFAFRLPVGEMEAWVTRSDLRPRA